MRSFLSHILSRSFSLLSLAVLLSGSLVFLLFAVGMFCGGETGALLASWAQQIMDISLRLAMVTTVVGMLQMYASGESALQMDSDQA